MVQTTEQSAQRSGWHWSHALELVLLWSTRADSYLEHLSQFSCGAGMTLQVANPAAATWQLQGGLLVHFHCLTGMHAPAVRSSAQQVAQNAAQPALIVNLRCQADARHPSWYVRMCPGPSTWSLKCPSACCCWPPCTAIALHAEAPAWPLGTAACQPAAPERLCAGPCRVPASLAGGRPAGAGADMCGGLAGGASSRPALYNPADRQAVIPNFRARCHHPSVSCISLWENILSS